MKSIRFDTLFLLVAVIWALGSQWSLASCIFLFCAAVYMLANVIPQLWRYYHETKGTQKK
nr:MAG TPA: hypothetical protein [Caudoviricetes sp.]